MPLFDKDGTEVEGALSAEEVEAKLTEEKEKIELEASEELEKYQKKTEEEVTKMQESITAKEEELEKERTKDKNFSHLRGLGKEKDETISKLTEDIEGMKKDLSEKFEGMKKEKEESAATVIETKIKEIAGDDKELAEKITYHYKSLIGEEDVQKRLESAQVLATGGQGAAKKLDSTMVSSKGGSNLGINPTGEKLGGDARDVAKKLGITDQDLEKHNL